MAHPATPPPPGGGALARRCAGCHRMIGDGAPETMVMVVHRRRVRWLHERCALSTWARLAAGGGAPPLPTIR